MKVRAYSERSCVFCLHDGACQKEGGRHDRCFQAVPEADMRPEQLAALAKVRPAKAKQPAQQRKGAKYWDLGQRIKAARVAAGLMQGELAKLVGVSQSTISGCESGFNQPDRAMMLRIAAAVGVDAESLGPCKEDPKSRKTDPATPKPAQPQAKKRARAVTPRLDRLSWSVAMAAARQLRYGEWVARTNPWDRDQAWKLYKETGALDGEAVKVEPYGYEEKGVNAHESRRISENHRELPG